MNEALIDSRNWHGFSVLQWSPKNICLYAIANECAVKQFLKLADRRCKRKKTVGKMSQFESRCRHHMNR